MSFVPSENPITNPTRESYTVLRPFRFWCQKVLPLVYDDSLSYYELLCKVVDYLNKTMEDVDHMNTDMDTLYSNFQEFQEGTFRIYNELVAYVNTYFNELDVQEEIDNKLDAMVTSGELVTILQPSIANEVASWLSEHISPTTPTIDDSLSVSGAGADAKVTGDNIRAINKNFTSNVFDAFNFENGAIRATDGVNVNSSDRIRTKGYINKTWKKIYSTDNAISFFLYAYNNGVYVGGWTTGTTFNSSDANPKLFFDLTEFMAVPAYENYEYKIVVRKSGGSIQMSDTALLNTIRIDNYIPTYLDKTLTREGFGADAKSTGDAITAITRNTTKINLSDLNNINLDRWESGAIDSVTGETVNSTSRVRTKEYLPTNSGEVIIPQNRGFFIYAYDLLDNYIGAYTTDNGFVTTGYPNGYNRFDIGKLQKEYYNYRFKLSVYSRDSSDVTLQETATYIITNIFEHNTGSYINVMQYNIGKFNWGHEGGLSTNIPEKILNYRRFLGSKNCDIIGLQEYTQYIDNQNLYTSDMSIFNPLYEFKGHYERETAIFSRYRLYNSFFSYLHTEGDKASWCVYGDTYINGKLIRIVSGVLNVESPEGINHSEQQIRAMTKLVEQILGNSYYAIVMMDTNCLSVTETENIKNYLDNVGHFYTGNWYYFGYYDTYNLSSQMYKSIDNIFTKNLSIVDFDVPSVYADLSSDHFPVISKIKI